jgi:hypothetical protein
VIGWAAAVVAVAAAFTVTHFSMSSDTNGLISPHLAYLQREKAFSDLFQPEGDQIVVVIDAVTPELAADASSRLAARMAARRDLFVEARDPAAGFFTREGLLFTSQSETRAALDKLIAAQPFLGSMAADPSLRGLMGTLSTAIQGVSSGQARLADLPLAQLADTLARARARGPVAFSWQNLIAGGKADRRTRRRFVLATPVLNYAHLESGRRATDFIRQSARTLGLDATHGVTVRLTGPIPLRDGEFGTLIHGVAIIAALAAAAILLMLWLAVRSRRLILAILLTMIAGLVCATAVGLLIFGAFNVISVAFIPLFVGLGIDFGIQVSVRFRAEQGHGRTAREALTAAAGGMGRSLILAAAAVAAGFLAMAPTAYVGVSQLGVIAGLGMVIAVTLNLTLLPVLIVRLNPPPTPPLEGDAALKRLDGFILGRRREVIALAVVGAVVSAALLPLLRFDFNPLHLQNRQVEAVATLLELLRDPDQSANTLEVIAPNLGAADDLARRLARLPEVAQARTISDFIPPDQAPKLAAIADAANLLDLTLDPLVTEPPPSDAETVAALRKTAADLRAAAGAPGGTTAKRLAGELEFLASAPPAARARAAQALIPGLQTVLRQARETLAAQPVTLANLPPEIRRDWLAPDGRARVSVAPSGDSNDNGVLKRFIAAVQTIAPNATGSPIGIREGGRTVETAFIEAGALSFLAITGLLFAVLRRPRDVAITLAPIILTGLLTLASCVVIGQPLNFANIIALPLLFGIGVAFHIYFVMAWRAGTAHLLQSSLTRAIFFSALATATGFGSLWASSHPGTASMGKLLMISLVWTLVSALLFQPALMGPPREEVA